LTSSLVNELVSHVLPSPQKIEAVFVGQRFIAVRLCSGDVGLAVTPLTRFDSCVGLSKLSGSFTQCNSSELAKFCTSQNSFLKAIGLATINAVLQKELKGRSDFLEGDFLKYLKIEPDDNVATIDYYTTKINLLKKANLTVFDDRFAGKRTDFPILPMSSLLEELPKADIVVLPPSFIDKIQEIRRLASRAREFVVVHPTTPPLPEPFFKRSVTMIATMMILDSDSLFRYVIEGAGTTMFKRFCKKILFKSSPGSMSSVAFSSILYSLQRLFLVP